MTRCVVCDADNASLHPVAVVSQRQRPAAPWFVCPQCGAIYTIPYDSIDQEADHSRTNAWGQQEAGLRLNVEKHRLFAAVLDVLRRFRSAPARLLDYGSSFGGLCFLARDRGHTVYAIDILPEAIAYLRDHGIDGQVARRLSGTTIGSGAPFDAVVSLDSIYYWRNVAAEMQAVRAILTGGGLFIIRTSDKAWLFHLGVLLGKVSRALGAPLLRKSVHDHLTILPLRTLLALLRQTDFEVVEVSSLRANPSDKTSLAATALYWIGEGCYRLFGLSFSAGFLVVARKRAFVNANPGT